MGYCALSIWIGCVPPDPSSDPSWPEEVLSDTPTPPTGSQTPNAPDPSTSEPPPEPANPQPSSALARHVEAEPNNSWNQAEPVAFTGNLELAGTMTAGATVKDIDIFDLGPASAGGRLQADFDVTGGINVQIGFFDAEGRILAYVDPISPTAGPDRVDIVLKESTATLYAMVATRSSSSSTRSYTAHITLESNATPSVRPQTVVLVFNGAAQVRIGSRPPVDVPAFDIAAVNPQFAGMTEWAIESLLQKVREDYDGLNVAFYRDADPAIPAGEHTYIYFGTSDTRLLGLADNIDPLNSDPAQSAIIYTDTFSLFNPLNPGFEGTVQVLANVASHETGHLLGLRHTADPEELMDVTATARQMLMDQWFKTTTLHASVLPLGLQDAPTMLAWGLGGELKPQTTLKLYARAKAVPPGDPELDFYIPRDLLGDCGCTECQLTPQAP